MHKKKDEVIPRILAKESLNLELWFSRIFLEKNWKNGFSGIFLDGKIRGLGPRGCGPRGD
jgi:hypothetical protein